MKVIKKNIKEAHNIKKSYADQHREFKEFQVKDHVYFTSIPRRDP